MHPLPNLSDHLGYYRALDVPTTATIRQIKTAGRSALRRLHPDGTHPDRGAFEHAMRAYRTLTDPDTKWVYDNTPAGAVYVRSGEKSPEGMVPAKTRPDHYSYWSEGIYEGDHLLADDWYRLLCRIGYEVGRVGTVRLVLTDDRCETKGRNTYVPRAAPSYTQAIRLV